MGRILEGAALERGVYQQILLKWRKNQEMIHQQEVHAFEIDIVYCYSVCLSVNIILNNSDACIYYIQVQQQERERAREVELRLTREKSQVN